jgi:hypothetical protein
VKHKQGVQKIEGFLERIREEGLVINDLPSRVDDPDVRHTNRLLAHDVSRETCGDIGESAPEGPCHSAYRS